MNQCYQKIDIDAGGVRKVLSDLIALPSVNPEFDGGEGEIFIASYVRSFLENLPNCKVHYREVVPGRPNVIGVISPQADTERTVLLEAHMDTVQVTNMTIPPFQATFDGSKIFGRGACDTKASLAAMLTAMEWLASHEEQLSVSVHLAATVDEEVHYLGILDVLEFYRDYESAIIGEPTGLDIVVAHKGCVRFEVETKGVAAHSSTPEDGANAIERMMKVIEYLTTEVSASLRNMSHPLVGSPTSTISIIHGGVAPNTVPDTCRIVIDRRTIPGEDSMAVWEALKQDIETVMRNRGVPHVVVHPPFVVDYAMDTNPTSTIVKQLSATAKKYTGESHVRGVPYGTDASKVARHGIPAAVFGPGSIEQAHTKDEWVELSQVVDAAKILVETLVKL